MSGTALGAVERVACYPVKSLRGRWSGHVRITDLGVEHDRSYAVYGQDGKIASGKTTRRFRRMPHLLDLQAWAEEGAVYVGLLNAWTFPATDPAAWKAVSEVVGEPIEIRREAGVAHKDVAPLHLMTTASLRWAAALRPGFDDAAARFRPNVVIGVEGTDRTEDDWVGRRLQVGACVFRVTQRVERCVMPTLAQDGLPFLPGLLAALTTESDACLGVYAEVEVPGDISLGDRVAFA
ncbi:MAG TPA: MOSC domain-containing protein [Acidimicrobiales bacterium]|nr:MOSC domain-containing protein [Acidimicrobiales bacterium]